MNKEQVCKELFDFRKRYDLPNKYRLKMQVVYGAAMVMREIRPNCNDIDIICADGDTFGYIQEVTGIKAVPYNDDPNILVIHVNDYIDIFGPRNNMMESPVCSMMSDIGRRTYFETDSDIWMVQTNVSLLVEKIKRNREKDQKDIVMLRNHLERLENGEWYNIEQVQYHR